MYTLHEDSWDGLGLGKFNDSSDFNNEFSFSAMSQDLDRYDKFQGQGLLQSSDLPPFDQFQVFNYFMKYYIRIQLCLLYQSIISPTFHFFLTLKQVNGNVNNGPDPGPRGELKESHSSSADLRMLSVNDRSEYTNYAEMSFEQLQVF